MARKFIAYVRVSTARQGRSGLGLEAQQAAIQRYLQSHGGELVGEPFCEVESGTHDDRPELAKALRKCRVHGASLLIARIDRLSRNPGFLFQLQDSGLDFVACDLPGANRFTVGVMMLLAGQERELISTRTKEALARAKMRGKRLGYWSHKVDAEGRRKDTLGDRRGSAQGTAQLKAKADSFAADRAEEIRGKRAEGMSFAKIADYLNADGIPTASKKNGARWYASTVRNLLVRLDAMQKAKEAQKA